MTGKPLILGYLLCPGTFLSNHRYFLNSNAAKKLRPRCPYLLPSKAKFKPFRNIANNKDSSLLDAFPSLLISKF
jgi:hypothetical protein